MTLLWEGRSKILLLAVVGLLALGKRQQESIVSLRTQLNAKPLVEVRTETKTVQGPVRIVEKIITKEGGEKIVERVITRDVVTKEAVGSHVETPICPAPAYVPRWIVGASANPARAQDGQMIRAGVTVAGRLDLTYGHSINAPSTKHEIATAFRF